MMKALVTGGTGFIGSSVVDLLLREGHSVRLFSRRRELPEGLKEKDIEVFRGDLKDFASVIRAMDGIDLFFHIGEITNITEAASFNNVKLIEQILTAVIEKEIRRFIFVSSLTVAGIPSVIPANEDTEPEVILEDHYTSYKRKSERLIINTIPGRYVILRPSPVYGPGSRYFVNFIRAVDKFGPIGFPFIGNAKNLAPLIYVKDLARAIYLSGLLPAASGQIFNLTDGIRHSWLDFLTSIAGLLDRKLRIMPIPPLLLKIPAIPLDMLSGMIGIKIDPVHYVNYFSKDLFFDNAKAKNLLNWHPEFSLDDGAKEMVKFYRGL
jgi:nucleoside-diphosphate-sugar epimerase